MLCDLFRRTMRPRNFADWMAFAEAWVCLMLVDLCLRRLSFRAVERLLALPRPIPGDPPPVDPEKVARCVWAIGAASRRQLWPVHCLPRSLSLARMLRNRGMHATLQFGVARDDGGLQAHAWVEIEGQPVGEPLGQLASFSPLLG